MSKNEKADGDAAPKKSKKKLLTLIVAAVFLLGGGAGGYLMLIGPGEKEEEPTPEPGVIVALDPVTINLADGHYLKVALALQATAEAAEEPDGSKALDLAIDHFGDMKMGELSSSAGRKKAKHELTTKVEQAYEGEVMAIYFREFVMQ